MGLEADCLDPETQSCVVLAAASLVRTLHNKPPGWTFSAVRLWFGSSVGTKESKKVKQVCSPSSRTSPFNILQPFGRAVGRHPEQSLLKTLRSIFELTNTLPTLSHKHGSCLVFPCSPQQLSICGKEMVKACSRDSHSCKGISFSPLHLVLAAFTSL